MRRRKSLIVSRDQSQDLGLFERKQLIERGSRAAGHQNSRDSHAVARDKSQEVAAQSPQPPEL
jgi:hypothetical protein